jgi:hypothetical protein
MFRSAPSINSRKVKETQHETISPRCAGPSRLPEFGWYLIKRVRRGSSVEMPAPICLTIPRSSSPSDFRGSRMQQVLRGDKRAQCGTFLKPDSTKPRWPARLMGVEVGGGRGYGSYAMMSDPHQLAVGLAYRVLAWQSHCLCGAIVDSEILQSQLFPDGCATKPTHNSSSRGQSCTTRVG